MSTMEEKIKRLKVVKETIETIKEKRSKLTGELDGNKKRLQELKEECMEKYQVDITVLPEMIKKIEEEAEASILKAEELLNIKS